MKLRHHRQWKQLRRVLHPRKPRYWAQYVRSRARHLKPGTIIETCGCDVARIISVDAERDDIKYESLTRGGTGSCSIYHCGPIRLRPYAVQRRIGLFQKGGMRELTLRYYTEDCGMTREAAEQQYSLFNSGE